MKSIIQPRGEVIFPQFKPERIYMREFTKQQGLPFDLARWQPTVDAMLQGIDTSGPIFIMVDAAPVIVGVAHRRPGLHIDGYWSPALKAHSDQGSHTSAPAQGGHDSDQHVAGPKSAHGNNPGPRHGNQPPAPVPGGHISWADAPFDAPEAILLASSVTAARGFIGEFAGCKDKGDCAGISTHGMEEILLRAGRVYAGNVTMLHESLPVTSDCLRTVVRLNVPGWSPA